MRVKGIHVFLGGLVSTTLLSGLVLASSTVSAEYIGDTYADNVAISVPIACTMNGVGMNTHNAEIPNGTYRTDIGTTTLKAYCNDADGFAIYAVGFTEDDIGETNSTKLVGSNTNYAIDTGTATSSGNPDISNWAMKLTTTSNPAPTYPLNIQNGYTNYSIVPTSYTLVASRDSGTDIGTSAEGSTLTTTYAVYISQSQPADTYTGQVKYTLVHPVSAAAPKKQVTKTFEITYDTGTSHLFFDPEKTQTQNVVSYLVTCGVETKQSEIIKTSNLNDSGAQNGSYTGDDFIQYSYIYQDASKIKVIVHYGITANTGYLGVYGDNEQYYEIYSEENNLSGTDTYILNGNNIHIELETWRPEDIISGYDYGIYVAIYPLDENNNEIPFEKFSDCNWNTISGTYIIPTYSTPISGSYPWFIGWGYLNLEAYDEQTLLQSIGENFGIYNNANNSVTVRSQSAL